MATLVHQTSSQSQSYDYPDYLSSGNVDKVVQSVTNATKRLSQISTSTTNSNKKRKTQNKIGPWKLGRTLGRGSTGRVRLAKNVNTGQLAAVKIVPKANFKKLENPKYKRASINSNKDRLPYGIEREIIIMKLINHQNIMGLYDVWENKNDLYLILEYIEGGELFDYLIKRGRLGEKEAIQYFRQIIDGINYLHQFNICHRDLKPENLLLDFNKNIKIADFGMAALEVREKLLETSCGSPHYASPEIVAGKNYHGAPSDIWSCGIILFALLTGHLPFDDENIRKLLLKVQSGQFVMPEYLSWEAQDLISQMLKVDPEQRITIESIITHPLLTKYSSDDVLRSSNSDLTKINLNPIQSVDKIDMEILKNLTVLFHNCDEETMISRLLSKSKCPEKMFYYLLMKYRNEHNPINSSTTTLDEPDDESSNIPRSASIVKTITVDETTGKKHTTITKIQLQQSYTNKKVLGNITNTTSNNSIKNFKASTSFNKKKVLLSNQNKTKVINFPSQRSMKTKLGVSSTSSELVRLPTPPQQSPPRRKDELINCFKSNDKENLTEQNSIMEENKENLGPMSTNIKPKSTTFTAKNRNKFGGTNKSLLNFGNIIDEAFSDESKERLTLSSSKPKLKGLKERERYLAARVHQINEERERNLQIKKEQEEKMLKEQQRQSILLEQKRKEAIKQLRESQQQISESSLAFTKGRRYVTETPKVASSLDPMRGSSLRASSIASLPFVSELSNPQTVLKSLGIDVNLTPKKLTPNLKSSGSRNLHSYLNLKDELESQKDITLNEFNKLEGSIYEDELEEEEEEDHNKRSYQKHLETYKSLLGIKDESTIEILNEVGEDEQSVTAQEMIDQTSKSNNRDPYEFIPNPRFSRFSMHGFLNQKSGGEGDKLIQQNVLTTGPTIKRRSRIETNEDSKQNRTIGASTGTGLLKKVSTKDGLGLGINLNKEQSNISKYYSNNQSEVENLAESFELSVGEKDNDMDDNYDDSETVIDHSEYENNERNPNSVRSNNRGSVELTTIPFESDISNFDMISTRTAKIAKMNSMRPSFVNSKDNSLEEVFIKDDEESIGTMYKDYENYMENKNTKKLLDTKDADLNPNEISENEKINPLQQQRTTDMDNENNNSVDNFPTIVDSNQDEFDRKSLLENANDNDSKIGETLSINKDINLRQSRASTGIFSTIARADETKNVHTKQGQEQNIIRRRSTYETFYQKRTSQIIENKSPEIKLPTSAILNAGLKPKRDAPKAPKESEPASKGRNRFSRLSMNSHFFTDGEKSKPNWFKKFFNSLTSAKSSKLTIGHDKNVVVINCELNSTRLIKIIKKQLQLKKMDGSISKVEIDEEFGLITGEIPAKFASGRKLKFKMEIINLIVSSSLHLHKLRGSEKGFHNFSKIVEYIIQQEENSVEKLGP